LCMMMAMVMLDQWFRPKIQEYYENQLKNEIPQKTYGIEEFLENRKNMIEVEICKMYKQISSIKYPIWDPSIINMEEDHLRAFCAKIEYCDQAIKLLPKKPQSEINYSFMQNMNQARVSFSHPNLPNLMQSLSDGQIIPTPIEMGLMEVCWETYNRLVATKNTTATT